MTKLTTLRKPALTPARASCGAISACLTLIGAVVFCCVPQSMADPDIWWHLRDAQVQLSTHSFLSHDLFSYTAPGAVWIDHEWLAELPFYAAYHLLGSSGLYLVTLCTIECIFMGLFLLIYLTSPSMPAALLATIPGVLLSTVSFGPRTLLFGWALLVVELALFELSKREERLVWIFPALFLLWVNVHGSWLIGLILFTLFAITSVAGVSTGSIVNKPVSKIQARRLMLSWVLVLLSLFVNPYRWHLVLYPFDLAFQQKLNIASIEEWRSLDFHTARGRVFLVYVAGLAAVQLVKKRHWTLMELGLCIIGMYGALTYSRFTFLAALLIAPVLATSLATVSSLGARQLSPLLQGGLMLFALCATVGRMRTRERDATDEDQRFPRQASQYLAQHPLHGRLLNDYLWGGFLIWNNRDVPVFVDSRVDLFERSGTFQDYLDIVQLKDSITLLNRYHVQYVLMDRKAPLIYLLKTSHWKVDYEDGSATLLERVAPE